MDIEKKEIFFRPIDIAIHLAQSENGHFLLDFRDAHGFLENEDTKEILPTIFNVYEDISTFLGDDEMVPSLGDLCQAEPKGGAPAVETTLVKSDVTVSLSADSDNKQTVSPCSRTLDSSGSEDFVNALNNAFSAASLRQIKQTAGPMLAEGLKKIHALWGHPSAAQLKKSLSHIEGLPNETNRVVERITKECSTRNKFLEAPALLVGGTRTALHFNHTLEKVFFFWTSGFSSTLLIYRVAAKKTPQ